MELLQGTRSVTFLKQVRLVTLELRNDLGEGGILDFVLVADRVWIGGISKHVATFLLLILGKRFHQRLQELKVFEVLLICGLELLSLSGTDVLILVVLAQVEEQPLHVHVEVVVVDGQSQNLREAWHCALRWTAEVLLLIFQELGDAIPRTREVAKTKPGFEVLLAAKLVSVERGTADTQDRHQNFLQLRTNRSTNTQLPCKNLFVVQRRDDSDLGRCSPKERTKQALILNGHRLH